MPAILPTPKTGGEAKNFELKVILYKGPFCLANLFFGGRLFYNVRSPNGDLKKIGLGDPHDPEVNSFLPFGFCALCLSLFLQF